MYRKRSSSSDVGSALQIPFTIMALQAMRNASRAQGVASRQRQQVKHQSVVVPPQAPSQQSLLQSAGLQLAAAGVAMALAISPAPAQAAEARTLADLMRPAYEFVDSNKDGIISKVGVDACQSSAVHRTQDGIRVGYEALAVMLSRAG
jgi:hypothetical protein